MLKDYELLTDKNCPLCQWYGNGFVKYKLLDAQGLKTYQDFKFDSGKDIDAELAKSKIALYNRKQNCTIYGVEALTHIIVARYPLLDGVLKNKLVVQFLNVLYSFISYNRKVVVRNREEDSCTPPLNITYRWTYIVLVAILTGAILNLFYRPIFNFFGFNPGSLFEYFVCFGQVLWQAVAIHLLGHNKLHDYLGNMSSVSMLGGILLIPFIVINAVVSIPIYFMLIYFLIVVTIMLIEHIMRCRLLGISMIITFSWIMYRVLVLGVIVLLLYH